MKTKVAVLFTAIGCALQCQAITLDECQQMAQENYPLIQQYGLNEQTHKLTLDNIGKSWLPQLYLSAQATYQSDAPTFPESLDKLLGSFTTVEGMPKDQYRISLELQQNIWDGGNSRNERLVADAKRVEQETSLDVEMYKLRETVNNVFFGLLLLNENIRQNEAQLELLGRNRLRMEAMLKNGTVTEASVYTIKAQELTVAQLNNKLKSMQKEYSRALSLLTGANDERLYDKIEKPVLREAASGENQRPELKLYDAQINTLTAQRKSLDTAIMPHFNLFANGFYGNPGLNYIEDMFHPNWSWNYMVGIRMQWNISGFYTRKSTRRKIETQMAALENAKDVFLFNSNIATQWKNDKIDEIRKQIKDDDAIIDLRSKIRIAAESELENGIIDETSLIQKITDEHLAKINKATHEVELLKAIEEYNYITNQH